MPDSTAITIPIPVWRGSLPAGEINVYANSSTLILAGDKNYLYPSNVC